MSMDNKNQDETEKTVEKEIKDMKKKADKKIEKAKDKAEEKTEELKKDTEEKIENIKDSAKEKIDVAKEDLDKAKESLKDKKSEIKSKVYFENIQKDPSDENIDLKPKKKVKVQTPIIIAGVILLLTVLSFLSYNLFFDNSIAGTWSYEFDLTPQEQMATSDEVSKVKMYFKFDKNGEAYSYVGNAQTVGTYTTSTNEEGKSVVSIDIPQQLSGDFVTTIKGNKVTGRELTLQLGEQALSFKSDKYKKPALKPIKGFKADEEIIGTWEDDVYGSQYTFTKDGKLIMNQSDIMIFEGVYTVSKENVITVKIITATEEDFDMNYGYDKENETLVIEGVGYKKVADSK